MNKQSIFTRGKRGCFIVLVAALLGVFDALPAYSQQPNEIRSGRGGVEFSKSRRGRRGSQYKSHRYSQIDKSAHPGIWTVGAALGASYNWQTREAGYAYDMTFTGRWGANAGVTGTYMVYDWLSIRADILYTQKNYGMQRMQPSLRERNIHTNYMHHYLQVPVMADWTFGSEIRSHIYTGAYAGGWLAGNMTRQTILLDELQHTTYEFTRDDNRIDGGLVGGLGISWDPLPYLRIGAEVLYFYSMSNTMKRQPVMYDTRYNNTIVIGVSSKYIF